MSKIGRHRNPATMMIFTLITFSFFTIIWICIALVELRKYRQKGINGYVVFSIVLMAAGAIYYFANTTIPIVAGIIFIIMLLFFFLPLFFYVSNITGNELNKLNNTKKDWAIFGLIPTLAVILIFIIPEISLEPTTTWLEANDEGIVMVLAIILMSVWVFKVQKLMNMLWKLGNKSQTMAEPEIQFAENSEGANNE